MRVLTPVVPTNVVAMAARIDSRLDGIGAGGLLAQSEQLTPTPSPVAAGIRHRLPTHQAAPPGN